MNRLVSPKEAGQLLGLSIATITRRLADGSIPHTKLGRRVLIPVQALEQLEAAAMAGAK